MALLSISFFILSKKFTSIFIPSFFHKQLVLYHISHTKSGLYDLQRHLCRRKVAGQFAVYLDKCVDRKADVRCSYGCYMAHTIFQLESRKKTQHFVRSSQKRPCNRRAIVQTVVRQLYKIKKIRTGNAQRTNFRKAVTRLLHDVCAFIVRIRPK